MSIRLNATVSIAGVAPLEMLGKLTAEERNKAAAQSVTFLVQRHLTDYNRSHPNKLGGKRTNFYRKLAMSTNWQATASEGMVTISDFRAAQTILGGTIRPGKNASWKSGKPTAALTIPAHSESYGESSKKFGDKAVGFYFKNPKGKLVGMIVDKTTQRLGAGKVRKEGQITGGKLNEKGVFKFKRVLYWLVSEVTQKARPDVIPSEDQIVDGAVDGVRKLVRTVFKDSTQATAVVWRGN